MIADEAHHYKCQDQVRDDGNVRELGKYRGANICSKRK